MTRSKKMRSEELYEKRKNQILEAAIEVFSKKGFEGSTTKEIAEKAKVAEGTIFRYYSTKKDILIYMLNVLVEQNFCDFIEELDGDTEPKEAIKNLLKSHYRFVVNNYELLKILLYEVQFHKELREKLYKDVLNKIVEISAVIISEIEPKSSVDPHTMAEIMVSIFMGFVLKSNGDAIEEKKIISDLMNVLFYGINEQDK